MSKQIVSTMPYESIEMVKIFQTTEDRFIVEFCLKGRVVHQYLIKEENEAKKAFGGGRICNHWDTDFHYSLEYGEWTELEKQEIVDLMSWGELINIHTWGGEAGRVDITMEQFIGESA